MSEKGKYDSYLWRLKDKYDRINIQGKHEWNNIDLINDMRFIIMDTISILHDFIKGLEEEDE